MNTVHLVTITKGGKIVSQFVHGGDADKANYLAGNAMDALCDRHGGDDWWYEVKPLGYVASMTSDHAVLEHVHATAVVEGM